MKLLLFLGALVPLCSSSVSGVGLYNVTFDAPIHTIGSPATTGFFSTPNPAPSSLAFGTSVVVPTFAGTPNPALQLIPGTAGSFLYSQYRFDLSPFPHYPQYRVDTDLILSNFQTGGDTFTIFFDTPVVVRLDFTDLGTIQQNEANIGSFQFGQAMHITTLVDIPLNEWNIYLGSALLFHGQFFHPTPANPNPPSTIDALRINLADNSIYPGSPVAVLDNFTIQGVPEPSPAAFAILFSGALWFLRRRNQSTLAFR